MACTVLLLPTPASWGGWLCMGRRGNSSFGIPMQESPDSPERMWNQFQGIGRLGRLGNPACCQHSTLRVWWIAQ
jgi:hypothetical protein